MAGILVGEDACHFSEIVAIFMKQPMASIIRTEWTDFARCLGIPPQIIDKCRSDILLDKLTITDVTEKILIEWRSRSGNKGTIEALLNIVNENFKWESVTDFLTKKIQQNANVWNDLDEKSKHSYMTLPIQFQGKYTTLQEISAKLGDSTMLALLEKFVNKTMSQEILQDPIFKLDNFNNQEKFPCYVNRTITLKRRIHPSIFREKIPDIFIIEGIQRHHLSILAQPELTDVSGGQIDEIGVRFILLEFEDHYHSIVRKAKQPVHRIRFEDSNYIWVSSSGSLQLIRNFLTTECENLAEENLVQETLSNFNTRPIAISSSPGMGKSILLASIANRVKNTFPERIVLFLEMRLFSQSLQNQSKNFSERFVKEILSSSSCLNKFGKHILLEMMNKPSIHFEIFLDGFDEIPADVFEIAKNFITVLLDTPNMRAFITSRPHLREELEETLGVITFDIAPFNQSNQVKFLGDFWQNKFPNCMKEKLELFAEEIFKPLCSFDESTQSNIHLAGIPLQCYMLAQVYSNDAKEYASNPSSDNFQFRNLAKSLFELYTRFMEFKFQNVQHEENSELVKTVHWNASINLLYPNSEEALKICEKHFIQLDDNKVPWEKVFSVGILESKNLKKDLTFVHGTFAEYLLTEFVVKNFEGNTLAKFIYNDLLATKVIKYGTMLTDQHIDSTIKKPEVLLTSTILQNPATCFFINSYLVSKLTQLVDTKSDETKKPIVIFDDEEHSDIVVNLMSKIINCVKEGYQHIFQLLLKLMPEAQDITKRLFVNESWCQTILNAAARQDNVEAFKYFRNFVEKNSSFKMFESKFWSGYINALEFDHTPLHEAVKRGNYRLTEYLVNQCQQVGKTYPGLIQTCAHMSCTDPKYFVDNKVKILNLLFATNVANTGTLRQNTPTGTHFKIFLAICKLTNVVLGEKDLDWFYRRVQFNFTTEGEMEELVNWMLVNNLGKFLLHAFHMDQCLLTYALEQQVLNPDTLTKIFNVCKFDLGNILQHAVNGRRGFLFAKLVVELTGNVNLADSKKRTILHWAAWYRAVDVIKYLLTSGAKVNLKDKEGKVPLHFVFGNATDTKSMHLIHDSVGIFLEYEADVKIKSREKSSSLVFAKEMRDKLKIEEKTIQLLERKAKDQKGSSTMWKFFK